MDRLTQLDSLAHDYAELRRILEENPSLAAPLGDTRDPDRHARYLVVADLAWQVWLNAGAAQLLLKEEFHTAALVVTRSVFEAFAYILYLANHPNAQHEAVIFLAFSYLQQVDDFSHDDTFVTDIKGILDRMPEDVVAEAQRRRTNRPYTWSGKGFRRVCEGAQVTGYQEAYPHLSANVHSTFLGQHVRVVDEGDGKVTVQTGRRFTELNVESTANLIRRLLHTVFKTMWSVFGGPPITLHTSDPFKWEELTA